MSIEDSLHLEARNAKPELSVAATQDADLPEQNMDFRTEEAMGNVLDLWTAFREHALLASVHQLRARCEKRPGP